MGQLYGGEGKMSRVAGSKVTRAKVVVVIGVSQVEQLRQDYQLRPGGGRRGYQRLGAGQACGRGGRGGVHLDSRDLSGVLLWHCGRPIEPYQAVGGHIPSTQVASESPGQGGMAMQMNLKSTPDTFRY